MRNISDALALQRTQPNNVPDRALYPVIVYIHSGDFSSGTSQAEPGHVLAVQNVVVVTFNYRLGALGECYCII
jgi:carboxylesterase type B